MRDEDPRLRQPDVRSFMGWRSGKSKRGGSIHLIVRASQKGSICNIQWWVLVSGVIDDGDVRVFLAWAPFTMPFWIVSWLRGNYSTAVELRRPYRSFYEATDMSTAAKSVRKICIDVVIKVLRDNGIDTSDLVQVANVVVNNNQTLNSGGPLSIGNLVFGDRNLVGGASGGAPRRMDRG